MLLERQRSQLLVVDIQERLAHHVQNHERIVRNTEILLTAARQLQIPVTLSEQYPKGLGPTVEALQPSLEGARRFEKTHFSCAADPAIRRHVRHLEQAHGRDQVVICGIESHICVLQTALGLAHGGHLVAVVMDAVGSRREDNYQVAMDRLLRHEIETVTTEMVLFEWMEEAATDEFRSLSKLIK